MINLIIFIQQISKFVLPHKYCKIIKHYNMNMFILLACISIIIFFFNLLCVYLYITLLWISYIFICYKCITILITIFCIHYTIINKGVIIYYIPIDYYKTLYYIVLLFLVLWGVPFISDTFIEILGDIKHIINILVLKYTRDLLNYFMNYILNTKL